MKYIVPSVASLFTACRRSTFILLLSVTTLLVSMATNAQTKAEQAAIERLVKYSYSTGRAGLTELYLEKVQTIIPEVMRSEWKLYPELRKLTYAFMAAEQAEAGSGEKLLALLSQSLAQDYEAIRSEAALKKYLEVPVESKADLIKFASLPKGEQAVLSPEVKTSLLKLTKYTDQGALGSLQTILYHYYGLDDNTTFEIINTSMTNLEALENGLAKSKVPPEHSERIRRMAKAMINEFPPLKYDKAIASVAERPAKATTSIDLATRKQIAAENLALKKKIKAKVNEMDILLPSNKEIYSSLGVKNEKEAKNLLNNYGYKIPEKESLTSYIKRLERQEYGKMFTSEVRTANIIEYNQKLKSNADLVSTIASNLDVVALAEKTLIIGPCSGRATICIRCGLPCAFPICLSRRR